MLKEIFFYELKYRFKRSSTYVYFVAFFLLTLIAVVLSATEIKGFGVHLVGSTKLMVNSAYSVYALITLFSLFAIFIFPAIFGRSIYRDFEYNTHAIYFTLPISKFDYLVGRFLGSLVVVLFILLSIGFGVFCAQYFPTVQPERFTTGSFYNYLNAYLQIVIPNAIFIGMVMFSMVLIFRDIMITYVASAIMIVGYMLLANFMGGVENHTIASFLDPFGRLTLDSATRYWTIADRNMLNIPLTGLAIANRVFYFCLGSLIFIYAYRKFKFSISLVNKKSSEKSLQLEDAPLLAPEQVFQVGHPVEFSAKANRKHFFRLTKYEFLGVINSFYFKVLIVTAVLMLLVEPVELKGGDYKLIPFTGYFLQNIKYAFLVVGLLILTFCTGELVWFERNKRLNPLYDTLPIPTWVTYMSKLSALLLIQFIFMFVIMFAGILLQTVKGYYNYEIGIYIKDLFGFTILSYLLFAVLTMFVHTMVNNKLMGHMAMLLFFIITMFYDKLGLNNFLFRFNESEPVVFSEMNGFGHYVLPFFAYKIYWVFFAGILSITGFLFWVRGNESSFKYRLRIAKERFTKPVKNLTILIAALFIVTGVFIYYNTNILNKFETNAEYEQFSIDYELKYKKLENSSQLRITDVFINLDIFPKERNFRVKGTYQLKNKTTVPIDSVIVYFNRNLTIKSVTFNKPFTTLLEDNKFGYHIYRLNEVVKPNDSIKLDFDYEYITKGFVNNGSNTDIVYNGTFLANRNYMPQIGYSSGMEIGDDETRAKYKLAPIQRANLITDSTQYSVPWGGESQFRLINFDAIVSTTPDQIAIAPGHLVKEWTENNRRYFHYKPNRKIGNYYSFLSANYQVKRETFKGVNLEIYYTAKHPYNIERMMTLMKNSMDYYTTNFSPFQYDDLRIVEFTYSEIAESFSTTIPFAENSGFTEKLDVNNVDVDVFSFVTDHEIAHQWWAHQVMASNVQGASFIVETLTQYSALMVLKNTCTTKQMNKYMKFLLDHYLTGRTKEKQKEMPLYKIENQPYMHYFKGGFVMWALYDYIGEENINKALRKVIKKYAFNENRYPTSIDVINCFKEVTPDSLQYIYADMFETITLYENRATNASYTKTSNGKYLVKLGIEAQKFRVDDLGKENEIPVNDWIDIGILDKDNNAIYLQKHKIDKQKMSFEIIIDKVPVKSGIDVFDKLIDKNISNNVIEVNMK